MTKKLLVTDLHFTSKSSDEHQWELFPFIAGLVKEKNLEEIDILGDLTTAKDNHSATLVNRLADGLRSWGELVPVKILKGNHDYAADSESPFFQFVRHFKGVEYIASPVDNGKELYLPHTRNPVVDWKDIAVKDRIVFTHVSVEGAVFESGVKCTDELKAEFFDKAKIAFSGDIHSRQQVGSLIYVGCPYQVRFNDQFTGGAVVLDTGTLEWEYLTFDFPKRRTVNIKSFSDLDAIADSLRPRDQVKIRLFLDQKNMGKWKETREQCKELLSGMGVVLHSFELKKEFDEVKPVATTPTKARTVDFEDFCTTQKVTDELKQIGSEIIKEAS